MVPLHLCSTNEGTPRECTQARTCKPQTQHLHGKGRVGELLLCISCHYLLRKTTSPNMSEAPSRAHSDCSSLLTPSRTTLPTTYTGAASSHFASFLIQLDGLNHYCLSLPIFFNTFWEIMIDSQGVTKNVQCGFTHPSCSLSPHQHWHLE